MTIFISNLNKVELLVIISIFLLVLASTFLFSYFLVYQAIHILIIPWIGFCKNAMLLFYMYLSIKITAYWSKHFFVQKNTPRKSLALCKSLKLSKMLFSTLNSQDVHVHTNQVGAKIHFCTENVFVQDIEVRFCTDATTSSKDITALYN